MLEPSAEHFRCLEAFGCNEGLGGVTWYRFLICPKYKTELSDAPKQPHIRIGILTSLFRLLMQKYETLQGKKKAYFLSADVFIISNSCQSISIPRIGTIYHQNSSSVQWI